MGDVTITFPGEEPIKTTTDAIAARNNDVQSSGEAASRESAGDVRPGSNGVNGAHLQSFVERIERLDDERRGIVDDIKEVFAEAKANGFDVKIMRKVIARRRRRQEEIAEEEAMIELYLDAVKQLPLPL